MVTKHCGRDLSSTHDSELLQLLTQLPSHYLIETKTKIPKRFLLIFEVHELLPSYSVYHYNTLTNISNISLTTQDRKLVLKYLSDLIFKGS